MASDADIIIIGGGSAGAVLAARLSEDMKTRVLLLEAGGKGQEALVQLPAGLAKMMGNPKFDWKYQQASDSSLDNRRFEWSAGKMLGGGSSINGQVHIRGTSQDFDLWEKRGARGWSWNDVLPYFIKSETYTGQPSKWRGTDGPLSVSPIPDPHPLANNFLNGCAELGMPILDDYADGVMDGAFMTAGTQRNGWRCSTEKAYLRPALSRPNLRVETHAKVKKILFEGTRAVGVELFGSSGEPRRFYAEREIVVSCGALGSPALLLRSGIGPAEELREQNIEPVFDSPEVGKNLTEHIGVPVSKFVRSHTYNSQVGPISMVRHLLNLFRKKGPLVNPVAHALALARSRPGIEFPDLQFTFLPLAYTIGEDAAPVDLERRPAVSIYVNICRPRSKGEVRLRANDQEGLEIAYEFLREKEDVTALVDGCKLADEIFNSAAWSEEVVGSRSPEKVPTSDEEWLRHIRSSAAPIYHPVGSCRMGVDERAVVLPDTRVRGVSGLRVVDASIMPSPISANTNAAVIMIGERAADLIRNVSHNTLDDGVVLNDDHPAYETPH